MNISRLTENIRLRLSGDPFIVFYGENVNDEFCDDDLVFGKIEFMLWRYFRENGYKRIVFFGGAEKIYFFDEESRCLCLPSQSYQTAKAKKTGELSRGFGPAKKYNVIDSVSQKSAGSSSQGEPVNREDTLRAEGQTSASSSSRQQRSMSDLDVLLILDTIIREDNSVQTIVIFTHVEGLSFFDAFKEIFHRMQGWAQMHQGRPNSVFIFQATSREKVKEVVNRTHLTVLENFIDSKEGKGQNIIHVGGPDQKELVNLFHYYRLTKNLKVDWIRLDNIARWLSAENSKISEWKGRLELSRELNIEVIRQWLSSGRQYSDKPALDRLNELIGLKTVKEQINRKTRMAKVLGISKVGTLHMAFLGNPGTGKTTIAELVGEIYRDIGILRRGHTVTAENREALVAEYEGQTAPKVNSLIDRALDGVLFIDEAHNLIRGEGNDPFGNEAVRTLVARMERERNRLCVILAGYPEPIRRLIASDPGLRSRVKDEIVFEDYLPDELLEIFRLIAEREVAKEMPEVKDETIEVVSKVLSGMYKTRNREDWGNAREVRNLYEEMIGCYSDRVYNTPDDSHERVLLPEDIPDKLRQLIKETADEDIEAIIEEINSMVGLGSVKEFTKRQVALLKTMKRKKKQGKSVSTQRSLHMIFTGNPGTGKTTIARKMGKIFKSLGILSKGHCIETDRAGLVAGYVGQTAIKAEAKIRESLDGVLFIDEAYTLSRGGENDFGREAIDQLVSMMENYRDRFVVIVAGYPDEMKQFINTNPGLQSRFTQYVHFEDYSPSELMEIFKGLCREHGYKLSLECEERLNKYIEAVFSSNNKGKGFGNAREIRNLFQNMEESLCLRIAQKEDISDDVLYTFMSEDIPEFKKTPISQQKIIASPKRLLSLKELPISLPQNDTISAAANPLKMVLPAVGYVEVNERDGKESSGSGFVINANGKFITCYHVIENARSIRVRFDNNQETWFDAELFDGDATADIAILKLKGNDFTYALIASCGDKVELGENVGLLGYPLGNELGIHATYTAGVISSIRDENDGITLYQIDANAYHGNSGGPLFRQKDGKIIGVLTGGMKEANQINFAISINELYKRFIKE